MIVVERTGARSRTLVLAVASLFVAACYPPAVNAVRGQFAGDTDCPDSRVSVKVRSDLDPTPPPSHRLEPANPPAEVAGDPQKLAAWNADLAEMRRRHEEEDEARRQEWANTTVVEAQGCDVRKLYVCKASGPKASPVCSELATSRPRALSAPAAPTPVVIPRAVAAPPAAAPMPAPPPAPPAVDAGVTLQGRPSAP
jgi:hypothetical protein